MANTFQLTALSGSETALSVCDLDEAAAYDAEMELRESDLQEAPVVDQRESDEAVQITTFYRMSPDRSGIEGLKDAACYGLIEANHREARSVLIRMEPTLPGDPMERIVDIGEGVRWYLETHMSPLTGALPNRIERVVIGMHAGAFQVWNDQFARFMPEQLSLAIETLAAIQSIRANEATVLEALEADNKLVEIRKSSPEADALRVQRILELLRKGMKGFSSLTAERQYEVANQVIDFFIILKRLPALDAKTWDASVEGNILFFADTAVRVGPKPPPLPRTDVIVPRPSIAQAELLREIEKLALPAFEDLSFSQRIRLAEEMLKAREDMASFRG